MLHPLQGQACNRSATHNDFLVFSAPGAFAPASSDLGIIKPPVILSRVEADCYCALAVRAEAAGTVAWSRDLQRPLASADDPKLATIHADVTLPPLLLSSREYQIRRFRCYIDKGSNERNHLITCIRLRSMLAGEWAGYDQKGDGRRAARFSRLPSSLCFRSGISTSTPLRLRGWERLLSGSRLCLIVRMYPLVQVTTNIVQFARASIRLARCRS